MANAIIWACVVQNMIISKGVIKMEPIIMRGKDMIDFQNSQGDTCYFNKDYQVVNINPNYKYLVGLDELEKNSIIYKVIKEDD